MLKVNKAEIENFWYYYKIHVIVGIFILFILIMTLKDCANRIEPDVSIAYIGKDYIGYEEIEDIKNYLSEVVADINADGRTEVSFQVINLTDEPRTEADFAMQQKVMLLFAAGEAELLIVDKEQYEKFARQGFFEPIPELADKYGIDLNEFPELKVIIEETGEDNIYGLPLKGSRIFEEKGFKTEGHYVALKVVALKEKEDETKMAMYDNAYSIIDKLMEK